ncbi:Dimeric alpha-beta barrel [Metarhizium album ARSEF 1941]|uniref:Dimeric alpha-beta barrel n=1 Tax=Metarhizium album (strain ARSEF 1941) TaxID=1081103 RepID=A0A0B2WTB3_METAS|nr:Dimeric alpha-beta barrel [Metarhizium album ARSEF 1941]KHN96205.1 Dimeric alpha-beta barrel [Metarhizium album ARSEF 1941]
MSTEALGSFKTAMEAVYGPLDSLTADDAKRWVPPCSPGAGGHGGRYLWTDAFGVVNLVTLYKETGTAKYLDLAARLVSRVHDVLGRTRDGAQRLPGATDDEPLKGGLRIGKFTDSGADCDGQYHHYLTMWMYALNRVSVASGDPKFNDWAVELAKSIHGRFAVRDADGNMRMVWKVSVDMEEVLVPSEGHLDAATGFAVYRLLQQTAASYGKGDKVSLRQEMEDCAALTTHPGKLVPKTDFLDLGMGLWMCQFVLDQPWAEGFMAMSLRMLQSLLGASGSHGARPRHRGLAFREFGACLGVRCVGADGELQDRIDALVRSWDGRGGHVDEDLRPISHVMYASALIPGDLDYLNRDRTPGHHQKQQSNIHQQDPKPTLPTRRQSKQQNMASVAFMYHSGAFNFKYFQDAHMRLISDAWGSQGLESWEVTQFEPGLPYMAQVLLKFETMNKLERALSGNDSMRVLNDIPNFTTGQPHILKGTIRASHKTTLKEKKIFGDS